MRDALHTRLSKIQEKAPSNKTPAPTKSMNMDIRVDGASIKSLWEVLKLKQNFQKNKVVTSKTAFFVIGPFCTSHFICLNIGFWLLKKQFFIEPCVKSVRIRSFSGPYFPVFGLNSERYVVSLYSVRTRENTNPKNSKYEHFSRRGNVAFSRLALSTGKAVF